MSVRRRTCRSRVLLGGCLMAAVALPTSLGGAAVAAPARTAEVLGMVTTQRPNGPAADLSEELTGGDGVFIATARPGELEPGYIEQEYVATGRATAYTEAGARTSDGRWTFEPDGESDYRTRVLVRRPKQAADFSGTVLVEWLNVSSGADADPDYATTHEEIGREGHIWVGVSAQELGVEGGPVAVEVPTPKAKDIVGKGLKALDPARYGSLAHPGDAYAYDIFTQVARAVRDGGAPVGDRKPAHVVALGQSQSAVAMTTYINGVQPLTRVFDGFFVHSRFSFGLPLASEGRQTDLASSFGGTATILRTDLGIPIFELQTEGDVTGLVDSVEARQPDTKTFRLWEVAGTSHADLNIVGDNASTFDCGVPINDGPLHVVAKAALHHFVAWVATGTAPPKVPLLEVTEGDDPEIVRDDDGIAIGGVRTPPVDVPVRVLSSVKGPVDSIICLLLGSTKPMSAERLAELYSSRKDFERKYGVAADRAIKAGFVLTADRKTLDGFAHGELVEQ